MKILAISDEESPYLWESNAAQKLKDYDLILSSGDLKSDYLSFLVTMAKCPVLYVHGNHDGHYATRPPEGCDCIEDKLVVYNGMRILGLGGCIRYRPGPISTPTGRCAGGSASCGWLCGAPAVWILW